MLPNVNVKLNKMARNDIDGASLVADLTSKYAKKPWNETFHLLRRCMGNFKVDSTFCTHIGICLQRLQNAQNVSSLRSLVSSLEAIAERNGLASHLSPTETACYLTADLFYLEVLLKADGGLEDVKVALHGEAPVSSELLLQLLRQRRFEAFSTKLKDLSSRYNVPGDNDAKIKVCTALQFLEKDLLTMSDIVRSSVGKDVHIDTVVNGKVGLITASGPEIPMKIQYLISPSDLLLQKHRAVFRVVRLQVHCARFSELFTLIKLSCLTPAPGQLKAYAQGLPYVDGLTQTALVMLGSSRVTHQLQLAPLIPSPLQIDAQGLPVFSDLSDVASESLPAHFILSLKPPVVVFSSIIHRIEQISDVGPLADQQRESVMRLLRTSAAAAAGEGCHCSWNSMEEEADYLVTLPSKQVQRYVLVESSAQTEGSWEGALIDSIPFTHPAHVPPLLQLLRQQSTLNILLASCITGHQHHTGMPCDLYCEVIPQSEMSFSVTFLQPGASSLSVLVVTVVDFLQVRCQLFAPQLLDDSTNDYVSRVMTRCMSVPITLWAVCKRLLGPVCPETPSVGTDEVNAPPDEAMDTAAVMDTTDTNDQTTLSPEMTSVKEESPCPPVTQNAPEEEEEDDEEEEEHPEQVVEGDASPDCYVVSVSSVQEEMNDGVNNTDTAATDAAEHYPLSSAYVFPPCWPAKGPVAEPV